MLVSDYELLDFQLAGRGDLGKRPKPLLVRLDWVKNLGADDRDEGYRIDLIWGQIESQRWELGISAERIQRDAVLGAFNSDDWWNHSWFCGQLAWFGVGFTASFEGRIAVVRERRDDLTRHLERYLLDFTWRF